MKNRALDHVDNWATPSYIYDPLHAKYNFDFDPCPLHSSFDGLKIPWGQRNFVNPPYGRALKEAFVRKAVAESQLGKLCVLLLPVSTSTALFHDVIKPHAKSIEFLRGRVKFVGINTFGQIVSNVAGMHDSMIVVFESLRL